MTLGEDNPYDSSNPESYQDTNKCTKVCYKSCEKFKTLCKECFGKESETFQKVEDEINRYYEASVTDPIKLIDLCWSYIKDDDAKIDEETRKYLGIRLTEMVKN